MRYTIIGASALELNGQRIEPGSGSFEALLDPMQEDFLTKTGHIKRDIPQVTMWAPEAHEVVEEPSRRPRKAVE